MLLALLQIEAECMELKSLQDVVNCIRYFKLESKFPTDSLLSRIMELEKEEVVKKRSAGACASKQVEKRARIENDHQVEVAPPDIPNVPPPFVRPISHEVQSTWQQETMSKYEADRHYISRQFVAPPNVPPFSHEVQPNWQQETMSTYNGPSYRADGHFTSHLFVPFSHKVQSSWQQETMSAHNGVDPYSLYRQSVAPPFVPPPFGPPKLYSLSNPVHSHYGKPYYILDLILLSV